MTSYSIYSIITGSGSQQVNFMEKFCVKAGISCRFVLYKPYWYGVVNPKYRVLPHSLINIYMYGGMYVILVAHAMHT